jgi:hypothetical protein
MTGHEVGDGHVDCGADHASDSTLQVVVSVQWLAKNAVRHSALLVGEGACGRSSTVGGKVAKLRGMLFLTANLASLWAWHLLMAKYTNMVGGDRRGS